MPLGVGHCHGQLVHHLSLALFGKPRPGGRPGIVPLRPRDDPHANPERAGVHGRRRLVLGYRLGILHRQGAQLPRGRQPGIGRARDEHAGHELRGQARRKLYVRHLVVPASEAHRPAPRAEQCHDQCGVLDQPGVTLVVRGGIAERRQVVLEASRHHVEVDAPPVQEAERRDQLRDAVGVHVDGLHRDEWSEPLGVGDQGLRHEPRVHGPVVGIDQQALKARCLAPPRYFDHLSHVVPRRCTIGRGTGREESQGALDRRITHWHLLARASRCKKRALRVPTALSPRCGVRATVSVHVQFLRLTSPHFTEAGVEHSGD